MIRRVTVRTGARLHCGPLAVGAAHGRSFGGVGLMIDRPGWEIALEPAERDEVSAHAETDRIAAIRDRFRQFSPAAIRPCRIAVAQRMPAHAGLGSGTQLALAIAQGLSRLNGEAAVDVGELARRTGRGQRSAIGTHGFAAGGFLVDAGRPNAGRIGELAYRTDLPTDWRFLLATPQRAGLSGSAERRAFESLHPMPDGVTAALCRIVLMDWMPAIRAGDFLGFCSALDRFGQLVGEYFQPVQGGVFADEQMAALAAELHAAGLRGIAQSSWGPTIVVCCENESAALRLQSGLAASARWNDCEFRIVRPLNTGARVAIAD